MSNDLPSDTSILGITIFGSAVVGGEVEGSGVASLEGALLEGTSEGVRSLDVETVVEDGSDVSLAEVDVRGATELEASGVEEGSEVLEASVEGAKVLEEDSGSLEVLGIFVVLVASEAEVGEA